jgi:site-specific recombinase XerD
MGVTSYRNEVSPGVFKTLHKVTAEGINKYTGKRIQIVRAGIASEPKAQRLYRELWNQCREERPDGPALKCWADLLASYLQYVGESVRGEANPNGFSPRTVEKKRGRLRHLKEWNDLHLDLINPHLVRTTMDRLEKDGIASRELTSEIQKEVKCLFSYAADRGILPTNPLAKMEKRKVPKKRKQALTHEEANRLLSEARVRNHPYFFIWLLSVTLGVRRSELAGLKWLDIDFNGGLAHIRRQLIPREGIVNSPKDKEERIVAIPVYVIPILKEYRLKTQGEYVIDVDCARWKSGQQAQVLREFCQEIGIKEVTHHQLRATHITLALVDGIPLGIVMENVGHAKLSTTDEYFRSSGIQMRGQTDGLKIKVPTGLGADIVPLNAAR